MGKAGGGVPGSLSDRIRFRSPLTKWDETTPHQTPPPTLLKIISNHALTLLQFLYFPLFYFLTFYIFQEQQ